MLAGDRRLSKPPARRFGQRAAPIGPLEWRPMKFPKRLNGQGGPDAEREERGSEETTRLERARRERVRAQRRLAAKAGGKARERPTAGRKGKPKPKAEARAERSPRRARALQAAAALPASLGKSAKAARSNSRSVISRLGRMILSGLGAAYAIFFEALGFGLNFLIAIALLLAGPVRAGLRWFDRVLRFASAAATPIRVTSLVVACAAVLLALSQFADYRSVSIGTDAYAEVNTAAPAPERERAETGSAHSYAMVPVAVISLLLLFATVYGRRRRLSLLIAGCGVIAIAVSLLIDRPAGLDPGELELAFDGVTTTLLGGFYAQLFAGVLLTASSLILGRELRLAAATKPAPSEPRLSRNRLLKRPPKPKGAST